MRFQIDKEDLLAAILTVSKGMALRSSIPHLEGIYMDVRGKSCKLKCSDLSIQIESNVSADVIEEGSFVFPGRLFADIVRHLPTGLVDIHMENLAATITASNSKTVLQGLEARDFPEMPDMEEAKTFVIKQNILKNMIRQSIFATAQDESKPILTGALLEMEGHNVGIVALDGYRLALRKETVDTQMIDCSAVIPSKSLQEIHRLLLDSDEIMSVSISNAYVLFDLGNTCIRSRLLEGEFIRYRQIIPQEHRTMVRVNAVQLFEAIERASLLAREGKSNLVKFSIAENRILITSNSEFGTSHEEIEADIQGAELDIAFNARYFIDVLKNMDQQEIAMFLHSNVSPCVIKPIQGENFLYLILPVRLFGN